MSFSAYGQRQHTYWKQRRKARLTAKSVKVATAQKGDCAYVREFTSEQIDQRGERRAREPLDLGDGVTLSPDAWRPADDRDAG